MSIFSSFAEKASLITAILIASKKDVPVQEVIKDKKKRSALIANGNVFKLLGDLIISPVIRVESSLKGEKFVEYVIKSQLDFFLSIYTRAFEELVVRKGFEPDEALHLLSSKRERTLDDINYLVGESLKADIEFLPINTELTGERSKKPITGDNDSRIGTYRYNKSTKYEKEGKDIYSREVEIELQAKRKGKDALTIKFNVLVRAIVEYIPLSSIELLLKAENKQDKSFFTQWHRYRAGEKSLKDLILASDLIEDEKRARLLDDQDLIKELHDREDDANRMIATHGVVGFGKYYQMLIISKFGKVKLENIIKERFDRERGKNLFLESVKALSVTVMDNDYDMAVTYFVTIPDSIEYTYKSLKKKNDNDEILDILKVIASR